MPAGRVRYVKTRAKEDMEDEKNARDREWTLSEDKKGQLGQGNSEPGTK